MINKEFLCITLLVFSLYILHFSKPVGERCRKARKKGTSNPSKYEKWFTQNLDHFNPSDGRTWQQRYFINDEYADDNSDIAFLLISGEVEANATHMTKGSWIVYAKEFKATLFQLEHRYYGKSHPTKDLSLKNLVYLTSQQALSDLVFFINSMNDQYKLSPDVKWIMFGCSYAGCLAAWLRQKFPHLAHGAMSASGPLLSKLDFSEYYNVVADALRKTNKNCPNAVKQAFAQVQLFLEVDPQNLNKLFRLCDYIEDSVRKPMEISRFVKILASRFGKVVEYNNSPEKKMRNISVNRLCDIMLNETIGPPIARLAAVNNLEVKTCLNFKFDKNVGRNISWDSDIAKAGSRQWHYQVCTEFGNFETSSYKPQIFGDKFGLDYFVQQCKDFFGASYNKTFLERSINRTNLFYGALDIEVTNVVFVHGSIDPWQVLGITKTRSKDAPAILIDGASHCSNMYDPSDDDTPQLKAAVDQIQDLIGSWLDL